MNIKRLNSSDNIVIRNEGGVSSDNIRLQKKNVAIEKGGVTLITPDAGYHGLKEVNVIATFQNKKEQMTSPDGITVKPDAEFSALDSVEITPILQEKTVVVMSDEPVTIEPEENHVGFSKVKIVQKYDYDYLTIEALEDGLSVSLSYNDCEYCIDRNNDWVSLKVGTSTPTIDAGQTLSFRANAYVYHSYNDNKYGIGRFTISRKCNVWGNIMSLANKSNPSEAILSSYNFYWLFTNNPVVSCKDLNLPPTTELDCYSNMFRGCTSLINAPELPATSLSAGCYEAMFYGCTSLVNAPKLPATTLKIGCYLGMFSGCTSLVNAPELPALEAKGACYSGMFRNCTSLVNAPKLPATTLEYDGSTGGVHEGCYEAMFSGCTSLINAPELPATRLVYACYDNMFSGCTSLQYIKAMFVTTPATSYTENWVKDISPTGIFVKNSAATWDVTGINGIPEGWTVKYADA